MAYHSGCGGELLAHRAPAPIFSHFLSEKRKRKKTIIASIKRMYKKSSISFTDDAFLPRKVYQIVVLIRALLEFAAQARDLFAHDRFALVIFQ